MIIKLKKIYCKIFSHVVDLEKWERPISVFYQPTEITCKRCGYKTMI